ncbi:histidine kinase [Rhodanobacter sp. L36]|uniref:sensor histidine kinase n=1 Tax=Rhodanobacter sp. L36 TaxID=1747221 RepID=UPI00131E361E|nr:histidine kinase [Rhodanobacter sp. L36]
MKSNRINTQDFALICAGYVLAWMGVCVLFAGLWFGFDAVRGHVWRIEDYARWALVEWSTIFIIGPFAFWAAARKPIDSPHRVAHFFLHLLASIGFAVFAVIVGTVLSIFVEPGSPNMGEQLEQFATKHGEAGFLSYWLLVMVRQTAYLQREKTRRELEANRLQAQLAHSRLQVLKMQLHPHFLFNTLHAAATLAREDASATEDMLLRLAELLRAYLDDDRQEILLSQELQLIDLYLGIQRVRFKDRLTSRVDIHADVLGCEVPSLILQPLVENAIGHGIGKHVGEDCIEIEGYREGDQLCLDVSNRNSTLDMAAGTLGARGIGLSNTRLRLQELYGDSAQLSIRALVPRGVVCRIRLPCRMPDMSEARTAGATR